MTFALPSDMSPIEVEIGRAVAFVVEAKQRVQEVIPVTGLAPHLNEGVFGPLNARRMRMLLANNVDPNLGVSIEAGRGHQLTCGGKGQREQVHDREPHQPLDLRLDSRELGYDPLLLGRQRDVVGRFNGEHPKDDDKLPDEEAEARFKALVGNLVNTPHKPRKVEEPRPPKADSPPKG